MGIAMRVGPSAFNAFEKASCIARLVRAPTAAQPKPLAVETMSSSGRSRAGTLGVFSSSANSLRGGVFAIARNDVDHLEHTSTGLSIVPSQRRANYGI